jgi:hypothetical protein
MTCGFGPIGPAQSGAVPCYVETDFILTLYLSANLLPAMLVEVLSRPSTLVVLLAHCAALQIEYLGHLEVVLQLVVEVVGQDLQVYLHPWSLACSSTVHPAASDFLSVS